MIDTLPLSAGTNVTIHYEPPAAELVSNGGIDITTAVVDAIAVSPVIMSIKQSTDLLATMPLDAALAVRAELSAELAKLDATISSRYAAGAVVEANVKQVNSIPIIGSGIEGSDEWRRG